MKAYKLHEAQKRLKYEQRIVQVENSSFNPLVFATTGGAEPAASKVMSRLAFKLSEKSEDTYAEVMGYIRTEVSFALLKSSAVLCLRGCRSLKRQPEIDPAIGTIVEDCPSGTNTWYPRRAFILLDSTLQRAMFNIVIFMQ